MKMKYQCMVLLTVCLILISGCKSDAVSLPIQNVQELNEDTEEELKTEIESLKADNQKLLERLEEFENNLTVTEEETEWINKYPQLKPFTSLQHWDKIRISSGQEEVTITEPVFLDLASSLFIISPDKIDFPNGPPNDIDTFTVELTNESGSYILEVNSRNYVSFPEVTSDIFRVSTDLSNLGKAYLPRPSYLPEESFESRLLNSGAMVVSTQENQYYYFSESRVRNTAKAFLAGKKKLVSESTVDTTNIIDDITFILHGQHIQMKVYLESIVITDGNKESYSYKIDPELSSIIHAQLSGS